MAASGFGLRALVAVVGSVSLVSTLVLPFEAAEAASEVVVSRSAVERAAVLPAVESTPAVPVVPSVPEGEFVLEPTVSAPVVEAAPVVAQRIPELGVRVAF